jgi:pyroglutamyl-peptidase
MFDSKARAIVTGFKPYLDHAVNPSETVVTNLDGCQIPGLTINGFVLPVSYSAVREFSFNLLEMDGIRFVLMLGLRPESSMIGLERLAINLEDCISPDETGDVAVDRRIVKGGPDGLFSTLPLRKLDTVLNAGQMPCSLSNSAGTYVCNSLFYQVQLQFADHPAPTGFIHLPPISDVWTEERLTETIMFILREVSIHSQVPSQGDS